MATKKTVAKKATKKVVAKKVTKVAKKTTAKKAAAPKAPAKARKPKAPVEPFSSAEEQTVGFTADELAAAVDATPVGVCAVSGGVLDTAGVVTVSDVAATPAKASWVTRLFDWLKG